MKGRNLTNMYTNICAIIPVYNEDKYIQNVANSVTDYGIHAIIVDDGSHNNVTNMPFKGAFTILRQIKRMGKGNALKTGVNEAKRGNFTHNLTLDGDEQHDTSEIPKFIEKSGDFDLIIGSRMSMPTGMPPKRIFVNNWFSRLISGKCKVKLTDVLCGYRLYSTKIFDAISLESGGYEIIPEILIKSINN